MIFKILNFMKCRLRKLLLDELWLEDYIKKGMKVGNNCSIQPGVVIDASHCWLISIGNHVTIAPEAYLLAHDASTKAFLNYTRIGSVTIEDYVFIGARAVIMPGVTIGKHSIIAAGSIVTKSVPEGSVVAGNPAKVIAQVEDYIIKNKMLLSEARVYDIGYTIIGGISNKKRTQMYVELRDTIGYVE